MSITSISAINKVLLDESSDKNDIKRALDDFEVLCSEITGIHSDVSFDAWAEDTFLNNGLAINPQAAVSCIKDYQRSLVFIRGVHDAILDLLQISPDKQLKILYAGCGPFATLLLPLLPGLAPDQVELNFLDIHQESLESASKLIKFTGFSDFDINMIQADACTYNHHEPLDLIISETMQKSLEQEPQFTVTANLAPQLTANGVFVPQNIQLRTCLAHWEQEKKLFKNQGYIDGRELVNQGLRYELGTIFQLVPEKAAQLNAQAVYGENELIPELNLGNIQIPVTQNLEQYDFLMFTNVQVYKGHYLYDYETTLTLPSKFYELSPLVAGKYSVSYQLGGYPKICIKYLDK